MLAAKNGGIRVDVDRFAERLQSADHMRVAMSLSQAGFPRALDLSRLGVSGKPGAVQYAKLQECRRGSGKVHQSAANPLPVRPWCDEEPTYLVAQH